MPEPTSSIRAKALDLLSRREHSRWDLRRKLLKIDVDHEVVEQVLDRLIAEGLLSDERFTEGFVRYRSTQGKGPLRIKLELESQCIDDTIVKTFLDVNANNWFKIARKTRAKRFGDNLPKDYKERMQQSRFLQYRGFTLEQIKEAVTVLIKEANAQ